MIGQQAHDVSPESCYPGSLSGIDSFDVSKNWKSPGNRLVSTWGVGHETDMRHQGHEAETAVRQSQTVRLSELSSVQ